MKILNSDDLTHISFPDFEVEKMVYSPHEKSLKIFVENAWLDRDGGFELGKGCLLFSEWDSISINRFDSILEKWSEVNIFPIEALRDLCEVKISDSNISLCGFGKETGQWMEWRIINAKMHAEFT